MKAITQTITREIDSITVSAKQSLAEQLDAIAKSKSVPCCYGCDAEAPQGVCQICHTDDLMRELPGVGVEYGTDWIIRDLLSRNLSQANIGASFEASITGCYPETTSIRWITYGTARAIKELDPVSWNVTRKMRWLSPKLCLSPLPKKYSENRVTSGGQNSGQSRSP